MACVGDLVISHREGLSRSLVAANRDDAQYLESLRRFAEAEQDLARAATLLRGVPDTYEADGQPNAAGVPRSTFPSNRSTSP